jgi:hypothetical protein
MAAMSSVTGFLSVAGAALTGIGALTGKKDLMKIGGLMSLGGGIASLAAGGAGGAAAGAGEGAVPSILEESAQAYGSGSPALGQLGQTGQFAGGGDAASSVMDQSTAEFGGPLDSPSVGSPPTTGGAPGGVADYVERFGQHVRRNKEMYALGGSMLNSMFGPEAEQMDFMREREDRRRRNLNSQSQLGMLPRLPAGG